jgi:hypothetical protein
MAFLRTQTGQMRGTIHRIEGDTVAIGRGEDVEVQIADKGTSRRHAEIFRMGALYFIRDLGSRNGTFVNDRRVGEAVLRSGDRILIADTTLVFYERDALATSRVMRFGEATFTGQTIRLRETLERLPLEAAVEEEKSGLSGLPQRIAEIIAAERKIQVLLQKVVDEVGKAFGADRADILLLDSLEGERRFRSVATFDTKRDGVVTISRTILNEATTSHAAILSVDASTDHRFDQAQSISLGPVRSVLCVPLMAGGATVAVLYLGNSQLTGAFDEKHLDIAVHVGLELSALLGTLKRAQAREEILSRGLTAAIRARQVFGAWNASRSVAVADYARGIALALELSPEEVTSAWVAGMLHGMGFGAASTEGQRAGIFDDLQGFGSVLEALSCQDERHDGGGTPGRKRGDEIPILGRVLALAKEIDRLMREGGPGMKSLSLDDALAALRETAGAQFDAEVVKAALVAQRNGTLAAQGGISGL